MDIYYCQNVKNGDCIDGTMEHGGETLAERVKREKKLYIIISASVSFYM